MEQEVVTVRPNARKGWTVSVDRSEGDLPFSTRQLALEFARAYARLRRAGTVQVVNERGILEHATVRPPLLPLEPGADVEIANAIRSAGLGKAVVHKDSVRAAA